VAWRVSRVAPGLPRRVLVPVALALAATSPVVRAVGDSLPWPVAWALEWVGATWLGVLFLTSCCLLVVDFATGLGRLLGRHVRRQVLREPGRHVRRLRIAALAAGATLSVVALVQGTRAPEVTQYEVRMPGLPPERDGTVLAVLSDLHLGTLIDEDWLAARVDQVEALHPDLVLLVGDCLERRGPTRSPEAFVPALSRLSESGGRVRLGVYAVLGNHEAHLGLDVSAALLERAGVRVLRDRWEEPVPGLVVAGIDDTRRREEAIENPGRIDRALAGRPAGAATVFLSHRPEDAERVAASGGVGLTLSGHTHGGQIWPFRYIAAWANPLMEGRYDVGGTSVIVTRGAGTWGPRMRLWRPGEVVRVTLRSMPST